MTRFVLDCSVSAAWCLRDETSDDADRVWEALTVAEALVPALWVAEMANVLSVARTRDRISAADTEMAIGLLARLPIHVESPAAAAMTNLVTVAMAHELSAYDASYVELAQRRRIPLATLDRPMRRAAGAAGIELLP